MRKQNSWKCKRWTCDFLLLKEFWKVAINQGKIPKETKEEGKRREEIYIKAGCFSVEPNLFHRRLPSIYWSWTKNISTSFESYAFPHIHNLLPPLCITRHSILYILLWLLYSLSLHNFCFPPATVSQRVCLKYSTLVEILLMNFFSQEQKRYVHIYIF